MPQEKVAIVRSLFDAFNDGDLDRAGSLVTPDFELLDVGAGQTFHGPAGCRAWLQVFRTALPDARTEIITAFARDEHVASEHIGRGTHTGPFVTPGGTIPPTGRPVELRIAEIYEVRDRKIARLNAYYDSSTLLRQLGLLPRQGGVGERAMTAMLGAGVKARASLRARR
jgi:steroid delta-isomerase-like uncharacterized protein